MILKTIRVTAFDLFDSCPYCFYLTQCGVRQMPNKNLELGRKVHEAIESYHNGKYQPQDETKGYVGAYGSAYKVDPTIKDPNEKIEFSFTPTLIPGTEILLTGKADRIKDEWIFDHKTSSSRYTQEQADKHQQTTLYSWLYRQTFHKSERGIRFNVLIKNKTPLMQTVDTYRTEDDYKECFRHIYEVLEKIKNNEFDPQPGRFHNFKICPMVNL
jgi:PD-(D/E)XK nuclease superfamily